MIKGQGSPATHHSPLTTHQVKILDFGLARFVSESAVAGSLTQQGVVMGTPDFIAPEQGNDPRSADIRADIYSLGCTLYFLLTAQPPFPEGTLLQKLLAHVEHTPRPVTYFRKDVPAEVLRILDKMTAKELAQRYQTPLEAAQALAPFAAASAFSGNLEELLEAVAFEDAAGETTVVKPPSTNRLRQKSGKARRSRSTMVRSRADLDDDDDDDFDDDDDDDFDQRPLYPPPVVDPRPKTALGLGITALTLGIIAFLFCWVPCLGIMSMPLSLVGLLLGCSGVVIGIAQKGRGIGFSVAGAIVSLIALLVAVFVTYWLTWLLGPVDWSNVIHTKSV